MSVSTQPAPTVFVLRKVLRAVLLTDGDLDAFCLDYFPDVQRRFAAGMDRLSKVNLLLQLQEPATILAALYKNYRDSDEKVFIIKQHLLEIETEEKQKAAELSKKLRILSINKHKRRLERQDTADIDAQIVAVKREQRQFPQLQAGELLNDRYELLEVIGKGGFARIWQAYDRDAERLVAVKVLHAEANDEPRRIERFVRGAKQMRDLSHPSIARVLDGPAEYGDFHYFVMEYFSGGDLARAVSSGAIERPKALAALMDIGAALTYAHKSQIIHRDVKPENILLDGAGKAYLTDFDLVWAADTTGGTRTGFLGTYVYVPPEQAENAKSVDVRADIYALAMTTLFVLHGKPLPHRALRQRALFIDTLDCAEPVRALLRRATADDPDDRPESVSAFCDELAQGLARPATRPDAEVSPAPLDAAVEPGLPPAIQPPPSAITPSVARGSARPVAAPRVLVWFAAALSGLAVLGLGFSLLTRRGEFGAGSVAVAQKVAQTLTEVEADLAAKRWSEVVRKTQEIYVNPSVPAELQEKAHSQYSRAAQEAKTKQYFDNFSIAAGNGNHEQAILEYRKIPKESVYREPASEIYSKIMPMFIDSQLMAAEDARVRGNCVGFEKNVQSVLNLFPTHSRAIAAKEQRCNEVADMALELSQIHYRDGRYQQAIDAAMPATRSKPSVAWRIIGWSACLTKNELLIQDAYPVIEATDQKTMSTLCGKVGINLEKFIRPKPSANAEETLSEAQTEYVNGNYVKAIAIAKMAERGYPVRAWRIIGSSACNVKDLKLINEAYRRLDAPGRQYLVYVCQRNSIRNTGSRFALAE